MIIMLVFMFKYDDHRKAPHISTGLSVENLIMFLLATPVQVSITRLLSNSIDILAISIRRLSVADIFTFKHSNH